MNANLIATLKIAAAKLLAETAAKVTRTRMFKTCFNALDLSCPQVVSHRFEFLQWGERLFDQATRMLPVRQELPFKTDDRVRPYNPMNGLFIRVLVAALLGSAATV